MKQLKALTLVTDSGALPGDRQMQIDRDALAAVRVDEPALRLRFFQWTEPTVTFGYLMDPARVREWAAGFGTTPIVQRPTGGGAVFHQPTDLSLSLLWARPAGIFPEKPRACYEAIHRHLSAGLAAYLMSRGELSDSQSLYLRPANSCAAPTTNRFSVCFDEPVCHDVMRGPKKVIGGALRITKMAILYQGAVMLEGPVDLDALKGALAQALGA